MIFSFHDTRLATKLTVAFATLTLLLAAVAGVGLYAMSQQRATLDRVVDENVYKMGLLQHMSESVHIVARVMRTVVLLDDPAARDHEKPKIAKARSDYDQAWESLQKTPASEQGRALRSKMEAARLAARPLNDQVIVLDLEGKQKDAIDLLMKRAAPATTAWQAAIDEYVQLQEAQSDAEQKRADADYAAARNVVLALAATAIAVAIGMAWFVTRSVLRQIGGEPEVAAGVVREIAKGNLAVDVPLAAGDEHSLLAAMKSMRDSLTRIVSDVRLSSDSIATGATQIATGNADLSQRTEEQASNLQQTAASMEQMNATVKQNAETAAQATQLAGTASAVAAKGGEVVHEVVAVMDEISASSRKISDIIGVIDGIAFQTNILALNAAVEAARAGEQGRGFAVVAGEVRTLAQRSAEAAREIKTLIGQSVEKVESGSRLVADAGTTMDDIVQQVRRVADLIHEMGAATREQSQGIGQVNDAVSQLDQVTQQNAALVEESAAASDSLRQQAGRLAEVVSVFVVADGEARRAIEQARHTSREPIAAPAHDTVRPTVAKAVSKGRATPAAPAAATAKPTEAWESF